MASNTVNCYHPKIISFSLWGDNECYNYMALENALIAQRIYPDWMCYIYYNETCIPKIIEALKKQPNVRMIFMNQPISRASNMFWRFIPCFESTGAVLVRDCDSIVNERERGAVDEFLDSSCDFHIMRDSPYHRQKIMGGMWGCKNGILNTLLGEFHTFLETFNRSEDKYNLDQLWLAEKIYPFVYDSAMIHASYHKYEEKARNFPPSSYKDFVGNVIYYSPTARKFLGEENKQLTRIRLL
jgi:hypothetical protein